MPLFFWSALLPSDSTMRVLFWTKVSRVWNMPFGRNDTRKMTCVTRPPHKFTLLPICFCINKRIFELHFFRVDTTKNRLYLGYCVVPQPCAVTCKIIFKIILFISFTTHSVNMAMFEFPDVCNYLAINLIKSLLEIALPQSSESNSQNGVNFCCLINCWILTIKFFASIFLFHKHQRNYVQMWYCALLLSELWLHPVILKLTQYFFKFFSLYFQSHVAWQRSLPQVANFARANTQRCSCLSPNLAGLTAFYEILLLLQVRCVQNVVSSQVRGWYPYLFKFVN